MTPCILSTLLFKQLVNVTPCSQQFVGIALCANGKRGFLHSVGIVLCKNTKCGFEEKLYTLKLSTTMECKTFLPIKN